MDVSNVADSAVGDGVAMRRRSGLFHGILWTAGTFGASFVLKLGSNVLLARLLAPEIFGVMVIVNSVRIGVELLSDVGVEQNIVNHEDGLSEPFFNTAWTIQILRGLLLTLIFAALTPWLSALYRIDSLVLLAVASAPLLNGLASTSIFALVKNMEVKRRNIFELQAEVVNFIVSIGLALIIPSVWALVGGLLMGIAARSALSYGLPHPRHRLLLDRHHVREILGFGKWIFASSLLNYASTYMDRLFIGRLAPVTTLGVYGIARNMADLPTNLVARLSYRVFYPLIARYRVDQDEKAHAEYKRIRLLLLMGAAGGLGLIAAGSDLIVGLLYDSRYQEAGPALFLLLIATWFALLGQLNEVALLGYGRARPISVSHGLRLVVMVVGLPVGFYHHGLAGAIVALIIGEALRYVWLAVSQRGTGIGQSAQDGVATLLFFGLIGGLLMGRAQLGHPMALPRL